MQANRATSGMKALIVYCHPSATSFNHSVLETVTDELTQAGAETRVIDLYAERFQPSLTLEDWTDYEDTSCNTDRIGPHVESLQWCNALIFVYPTWWFGQPAMLKGWLDRVLVPGVAFTMPCEDNKRFGHTLKHIKHLGVFTTCGASFWLTKLIGSPGKRILMRGLRALCHDRARTVFAAHYRMDFSTSDSRTRHLARVRKKMRKLIGQPTAAVPVAGYPNKVRQTA
ncbi:MAG: NAD(P)H-dependent oxidoreductase [Rhizobiales bacterium]|nr:NAD(P)H-dependent oxidoreductase [Hyphomicrobiales bacterium]MBO6697347.1 NAD(P)H-dependent oxidoreductase [Hyphomicrobiales bacterium]MBO6736398.1 NAD(P)H-dependent oxidoreductase [Hyphomicrobiales bacterium]MBO6912868.1 NAD(P)H-dependent oxidoreductase [Hyphomicrobiales bacterium]MBO6954036.1 NAD(P)H-dependent oxidoreductase [Hyphomicrobiales bacterium]